MTCDTCKHKYTKSAHDGDKWGSREHCAEYDEKIKILEADGHTKDCKYYEDSN